MIVALIDREPCNLVPGWKVSRLMYKCLCAVTIGRGDRARPRWLADLW